MALLQNEETSFGRENDSARSALGAPFQEIVWKVIWPPNMCQQHVLPVWCNLYANILLFMCQAMLTGGVPSGRESVYRFYCGVVQFCMMFEYWTALLTLFQPSLCAVTFTELFTFGFSKQWVTKIILCYLRKASPYLPQKQEVFSKYIIQYFNSVEKFMLYRNTLFRRSLGI